MKNGWPRVGVIGAGPMTQMMLAPAAALGIELISFSESEIDPAALFGPHSVGKYNNFEQVYSFAKSCDVITVEINSMPISIINGLERDGVVVRPNSKSFTLTQDKNLLREKLETFTKAFTNGQNNYEIEISVMVARSPHGQASTWSPAEIIRKDGTCIQTLTPVLEFSNETKENVQELALTIADEIKLIGVMAAKMMIAGKILFVKDLVLGPHFSGNWTIEGSKTSQFEQHLRAILDLPLGETTMTSKCAVVGNIFGGKKSDMYRPYLHLMARSPKMKFHRYKSTPQPGANVGHLTLLGKNLAQLRGEALHAAEYFSGVIDE